MVNCAFQTKNYRARWGAGMHHTGVIFSNPSGQAWKLGWGQAKPGHVVWSSSTGLGAETGEELEDGTLRSNRKDCTQMWPRDYILERNGVIQVDCNRGRKRVKWGPSSWHWRRLCSRNDCCSEHTAGNRSVMKSQTRCPRPGRIIIFLTRNWIVWKDNSKVEID